eukprot:1291463-Amphidinium_carterae.1
MSVRCAKCAKLVQSCTSFSSVACARRDSAYIAQCWKDSSALSDVAFGFVFHAGALHQPSQSPSVCCRGKRRKGLSFSPDEQVWDAIRPQDLYNLLATSCCPNSDCVQDHYCSAKNHGMW